MSKPQIVISLTVVPDTEEQAVRTVETLSRAGTGLAFDGILVSLSLGQYAEEVDDDE